MRLLYYIYTRAYRMLLASFDKNRKQRDDYRNKHTDRLRKKKKQ